MNKFNNSYLLAKQAYCYFYNVEQKALNMLQ